MFGFKKINKILELKSPVNGICIPLDEVNDKAFASGMIGEGCAFNFDGDTIYSPINGEILMVANTKHAIGLKARNGAEILIHVGLDTVNLNGEGLYVLVKKNQKVKQGDPILKVDLEIMKSNNIDLTTPMVITNSSNFKLCNYHIDDKVNIEDVVISVQH
ncbi:MAG: PTS glucose transporter subunit IIA [Erysipelotrichaceae bacterium]|nr:PTS glucose transporter subunit IIA [Erysipelotrichaceae bacterium]